MTPDKQPQKQTFGRELGSPMLFSVIYTVIASAIYICLGVVAGYALGLTPVVFFAGGLMFVLAAMTYVEGSSLHQERGGSTVFARFAFNEFWSFVAGWAILLDYVILLAAAALSATSYLQAFWAQLGEGAIEAVLIIGILIYVAVRNIRGFSSTRSRRIAILVVADIILQLALIGLGLIFLFEPGTITSSIELGSSPTFQNLIVALGIATVVSTGLESASGLSGEVGVGRAGLKRLVTSSSLTVIIVYTGIAVVAISAQPVIAGHTALSSTYKDAPMLGLAAGFDQEWLAQGSRFVIAAIAVVTLIAAANSTMLGLSRLAYSLSTHRQIPSALGRLHPTRFTPWVLIVIATLVAIALAVPGDLLLLLNVYAFGALLGLTIAHASIVRLRITEPDRPRPYSIPFNITLGGKSIPLPAVLGMVLSALIWISVVWTHPSARWVGFGWMAAGLLLYFVYRLSTGKTLTKRVTVPREALRGEATEIEYDSILVPITGGALDDDIMQTAGRLASEASEEDGFDGESRIEAIWVTEVPMSLPIDARLPEEESRRARAALARAKAVGEEYDNVQVDTARARGRRAGQTIIAEAQRRGVQAIVLGAEEPTGISGGALLGGGYSSDLVIGETARYVLTNADCPVIVTAPASGDRAVSGADGDEADAEESER
ncbi:MAG: amino acid permease [Solirubrobacterales bacterium]|nr:amino acid permease [Solirubrobacterales bacterium]